MIERHEANFKSDGVVTKQERRQLRNEVAALRDQVERMMRGDRRGAKIPAVNGVTIPGPTKLNDGDLIEVAGIRLNFIVRE